MLEIRPCHLKEAMEYVKDQEEGRIKVGDRVKIDARTWGRERKILSWRGGEGG